MKKLAAIAVISGVTGAAFAGQNPLYSNQSAVASVAALNARTLTRSGVAAAAGSYWSECQSDLGNTTESNTTAGFTGNGAFRLADDFTVGGLGWDVTAIKVYAYDSGSAVPAASFSAGNMNIWNAAPNAAGATIIATMAFGGSSDQIRIDAAGTVGTVHRIFNTTTPAPGSPQGTTRRINQITFTGVLNLAPGTYWIDFNYTSADGAGGFTPSTTHQDVRGVAGANALQWTGAAWAAAVDAGNPAAAPDVAQDLPFIVCGTEVVPEPATMTALALGLGAIAARRRRK